MRGSPTPGEDALATVLGRAVEAGHLTAAQAEAVMASERAADAVAPVHLEPAPGARVPPVLEALGYLGAVLVVVGATVTVGQFWEDLATWSRLYILGLATAALTGAGLAIREERVEVLRRLRSVVLLLATGALTGFAGVLVFDGLKITDEPASVVIGSLVAAHSGVLWWRRDRPGQHLACLGGVAVAATAGIVWAGGEAGIVGVALWAIGGMWLVASFRHVLPPAEVGIAAGAALALVGAGVTGAEWEDVFAVFGLATAAVLVAWGVRRDLFPITAPGVIGTLIYLPTTVSQFFGDTIGVPAVMLVSGLALLGVTALVLRRRDASAPRRVE